MDVWHHLLKVDIFTLHIVVFPDNKLMGPRGSAFASISPVLWAGLKSFCVESNVWSTHSFLHVWLRVRGLLGIVTTTRVVQYWVEYFWEIARMLLLGLHRISIRYITYRCLLPCCRHRYPQLIHKSITNLISNILRLDLLWREGPRNTWCPLLYFDSITFRRLFWFSELTFFNV